MTYDVDSSQDYQHDLPAYGTRRYFDEGNTLNLSLKHTTLT